MADAFKSSPPNTHQTEQGGSPTQANHPPAQDGSPAQATPPPEANNPPENPTAKLDYYVRRAGGVTQMFTTTYWDVPGSINLSTAPEGAFAQFPERQRRMVDEALEITSENLAQSLDTVSQCMGHFME